MINTEYGNWKEKLAISHRKHQSIEEGIKKRRQYYKGFQWQDEVKTRYSDWVTDNMVFSNVRTLIPRLNLKNPRIFVTAKKKPYRLKEQIFDTLSSAVILELLLNYYYKELQIRRETRKCLYDALLGPWGIIQMGYTLETEKVKDDELLEVNDLIKSESVYAIRCSPMNFRFDVEAADSQLNDANWIAFKWVKSLKDVKANPKYNNTRNLKSNYRLKTDFKSTVMAKNESLNTGADTDLWERVEGWDIWDKKNHKILTIVEEHDRFLRNGNWGLNLEGFPIEILYFNENPDEAIPISDVDIYMSTQDELNRIRSLQISHIRNISERKYIARENAFDEEEKRKITHGGDGVIAETSSNPSEAIVPLRDATISQDIYIVAQLLKQSIREMAGLPAFEKQVSEKYETATEPALINMSMQTLREDQRDIFEDFLKRIIRKTAQILQQTINETSIPLDTEMFKTANQYVPSKLEKIVGIEDKDIILPWLNLSKEDIQGEYDFDIEIGSTMPTNQEMRKRDSITLYQLLAQNPYMRGYEGTKEILEAFGRIDPDKYLKTEEEVTQTQMQMAQMAHQMEMEKDMPKRQVDLQKTIIKSQMADKKTTLEHHAKMADTAVKATEGRIKTLTSMLKGNGKKKAE